VMVVGADADDAILVLLHEMAHVIVVPKHDSIDRVLAHTSEFYRAAVELYALYGIPEEFALAREYFNHEGSGPAISVGYKKYRESC